MSIKELNKSISVIASGCAFSREAEGRGAKQSRMFAKSTLPGSPRRYAPRDDGINQRFLKRQAGISLVELILFIIIVSVGIVGILSVMNITTQHSADPMVRKQALAIAEGMLEEILLKDYTDPDGSNAGETRPTFDDVDDYASYTSTGIETIDGTPIGALADYNVSVAVAASDLNGVAEAKLITVTVTGRGESIALSGYRTNYAP